MPFPHRSIRPALAVLCLGCMAAAPLTRARSADNWPGKSANLPLE